MSVIVKIRGKAGGSATRSLLVLAVIFAAAAAGVYFGLNIRNGAPHPVEAATGSMPTSRLAAGTPFPDVTLFDEIGSPVGTSQLLDSRGGVVLFMELGCPPCQDMSAKWQAAIESGLAKGILVAGVTINLPINVRPYRLKHKLTFPIYSDSNNVFMDKYGVTNYPLEVVIGKSGTVNYTTFNSAEPIDFDKLSRWLAM